MTDRTKIVPKSREQRGKYNAPNELKEVPVRWPSFPCDECGYGPVTDRFEISCVMQYDNCPNCHGHYYGTPIIVDDFWP